MKKEKSIFVKAGYLLGIFFCLVTSVSLVYASYLMINWTFSEHPDISYGGYEASGQYLDITQDSISTKCGDGSVLCNGECWETCGTESQFQCTSSGGTCIPTGQRGCEPDGVYCNGQCWEDCPQSYKFVCTSSGAICE